MKKEQRFITSEVRLSQGDEGSMVGYASVFGSVADIGDFKEMVLPGAFTKCLRKNPDVRFLRDHNPSMIFARTTNGSLVLSEDGKGLKFSARLPNTQDARDARELVRTGLVTGCSFAFTVDDQSWEDKRDANGDLYALRMLRDVSLEDVSICTYPAYGDTEVDARHAFCFPDGELAEVRSATAWATNPVAAQHEPTGSKFATGT